MVEDEWNLGGSAAEGYQPAAPRPGRSTPPPAAADVNWTPWIIAISIIGVLIVGGGVAYVAWPDGGEDVAVASSETDDPAGQVAEPLEPPPAVANAAKTGTKGNKGNKGTKGSVSPKTPGPPNTRVNRRVVIEAEPPVPPGVWITAGKIAEKTIVNSLGMQFIRIEPASFVMGSPKSEPGHREDESPQKEVKIGRPFYMGVYEVTQVEYEQVMKINPSHFSPKGKGRMRLSGVTDTSRYPVESVTWLQAQEFCKKLNSSIEEWSAGRFHRLPTEAEWEMVCRAGTLSSYSTGEELSLEVASFRGPAGTDALHTTTQVGDFPANPWGLHDMHGNVAEWCADWYEQFYLETPVVLNPQGSAEGSHRLLRGGSWRDNAANCRSARRTNYSFGQSNETIGFRVICEIYEPYRPGTPIPEGTNPLALRLGPSSLEAVYDGDKARTQVLLVKHARVKFGDRTSDLVSVHLLRAFRQGYLMFWAGSEGIRKIDLLVGGSGGKAVIGKESGRYLAIDPNRKYLVISNMVYELAASNTTFGQKHLHGVTGSGKTYHPKVSHIEFSDNGKFVATSNGLWELPSGKRVKDKVGWAGGWKDAAKKQMVTVNGDTVKIWDSVADKELKTLTFEGLGGQNSFHGWGNPISKDGRWLAGRSGEYEATLWRLDSGEKIRQWRPHEQRLGPIAMTADGSLLATGSHDGELNLWDTADGRHLLTIEAHRGAVNSIEFQPGNPNRIVTAGRDGAIKIWKLPLDDTRVRSAATR